MKEEITTFKVRKKIMNKFKKLKKYPRETHEDVLIRLIKKEVGGD